MTSFRDFEWNEAGVTPNAQYTVYLHTSTQFHHNIAVDPVTDGPDSARASVILGEVDDPPIISTAEREMDYGVYYNYRTGQITHDNPLYDFYSLRVSKVFNTKSSIVNGVTRYTLHASFTTSGTSTARISSDYSPAPTMGDLRLKFVADATSGDTDILPMAIDFNPEYVY